MNTFQKVGIEIGQNVYSTFEAQANTVSHVLAEFVDNAIQSYRDHKAELLAINSGYQLHVEEPGLLLKIMLLAYMPRDMLTLSNRRIDKRSKHLKIALMNLAWG